MANKIRRILAGCLALVILCFTACMSGDTVDDEKTSEGSSLILGRTTYPMFSNKVTYERGGVETESEMYFSYQAYTTFRHTYTDMEGHDSEVSAVRLADMGVFEKSTTFSPDNTVTVVEALRYLFALSQIEIDGKSEAELMSLAKKTKLIVGGVQFDAGAVMTREQLAYLVDRAVVDVDNSAQYAMMITDYEAIAEPYRASVLQTIATGILECSGEFSPKQPVTRAMLADALYRTVQTGARVIPLYDLGDAYTDDGEEFLVKNVFVENPMGVSLGFYSNYNRQEEAFTAFGKRPVDRVSFYKWAKIETSKGVYEEVSFGNDWSAHKMGSTIISCVDISANLNWNPQFSESNIPSFYPQDITDPVTRTAAKQFLYTFVQDLLQSVGCDVILAIDYELDWQQRLSGVTQDYRDRAVIFADWYEEACAVAREAAKNIGAGDRLKLMVIYNNITEHHKLGVGLNDWMIRLAKASDYIGIDSYQFSNNRTLPNITLQNLRYLINNYSLGKPVIMVENGLSTPLDETSVDPATGLPWNEVVSNYYRNLFREFRFACEKGDFLNANLTGALFWSLCDTNDSKLYGVLYDDGTKKLAGQEIERGFQLMEKQKQFNPSVLQETVDARYGTTVMVNSGTTYDCLNYVVRNYEKTSDKTQLRIKLSNAGTVFIEVNEQYRYVSNSMGESHTFDLSESIADGFNVIKIYFGANETPFEQEVQAIYFR